MAEVSAGRILIMAVGNYNAATPYEPLDLVAYNDESWLCRKACTGVTPTAQASEYWQKFGSAVGIATVSNTGIVRPDGASIKIIADGTISVPTATGEALGLVKPDGSTITIDANGTLTANAAGALSDLTDVDITSASQGQILQYNVTSHKWENVTKQFLTELEQMADVDIDNSTLADGQALIYDVATGKWQNKAIAQYPKLDTVEQVMANTQSGKVADALAIKAINTAAVKKFSDSTYVTVDSIAYDETNQVLGLKVNGADTVIPFKKGIESDWVPYTNVVNSFFQTTERTDAKHMLAGTIVLVRAKRYGSYHYIDITVNGGTHRIVLSGTDNQVYDYALFVVQDEQDVLIKHVTQGYTMSGDCTVYLYYGEPPTT